MKKPHRWMVSMGVLALVGLTNAGCQTYQMGQVLPSAHHMRDDIQYFPKGPQFPLAQELDAMQAAESEHRQTR